MVFYTSMPGLRGTGLIFLNLPPLILEIQPHVLPMLSSLNGDYANTIRFRFVQLTPLPGVLETVFTCPFSMSLEQMSRNK